MLLARIQQTWWPLLLPLFGCLTSAHAQRVELRMPGVRITKEDQYTCWAYPITQEQYILQYEALSDASIAHHILVYGCKLPYNTTSTWECGSLCAAGESKILFAWAKNAPPTRLPAGVGYHVGGSTDVNYIVLQVHYIGSTPEAAYADRSGIAVLLDTNKPRYSAGVMLMVSGSGFIPPGLPKVSINVSCAYSGATPINVFAYRTHAHTMSTVVSGYKRGPNGNWELLAKGNPQWPQAFYPMDSVHIVAPGDHLVAQCSYNSTGMTRTVYMGATHTDEMCNLYMMYYTDEAAGGVPFLECANSELPEDVAALPAGSDVPLPRNVTLEEHAAGHNHGHSHESAENGEEQHVVHAGASVIDSSLLSDDVRRIEIKMPNFRPPSSDYYSCTSYKVEKEEYIEQYMALADAETAHHILLFACTQPFSKESTWSCAGTPCSGSSSVVFAWAKNARPLHLPAGVGYHIGHSSDFSYLVLQVHYVAPIPASQPADTSGLAIYITEKKPKYSAGVFLMGNNGDVIPQNTPKYSAGSSCRFPGKVPIYAFAFRTHAHTWSTVISGYKQVPGGWEQLAKGNPQWPQAFYPTDSVHAIKPGDVVAAQCTYNTSGTFRDISMGNTHNDEMCNLYIMFYTTDDNTYFGCWDDRLRIAQQLPPDASQPLPPNKLLEDEAHGHHHGGGDAEEQEGAQPMTHELALVADWAADGLSKIGQIGGLSTDSEGNVVAFHRGPVIWDGGSFDYQDNYLRVSEGPIKVDTILTVSPGGVIHHAWGKDLFYMPHGLTLDDDNNVYVTDVAMHQVFRFSPSDHSKPSLTLGKRFQPGADDGSFCKPSDVAVKRSGDFYVSDGYCNARIKLYSKDGILLKQWGKAGSGQGEFALPHALALSEELKLLCVADRSNGRIQCFDLSGQFVSLISDSRFGTELYSVAFNPALSGMLYAVNTNPSDQQGATKGFVIDVSSRSVVATFVPNAKGFSRPHDLTVSKDGAAVYVGEIGPNRIWKFDVKDVIQQHGTRGHIHVEHDHIMSVMSDEGATGTPKTASAVSQKVPIIVGIVLIVPVVVVVLVVLGIKVYNAKFGRDRRGFDMGKMLDSSTAHFNPLLNGHSDDSGDESGEEAERSSEKTPINTKTVP